MPKDPIWHRTRGSEPQTNESPCISLAFEYIKSVPQVTLLIKFGTLSIAALMRPQTHSFTVIHPEYPPKILTHEFVTFAFQRNSAPCCNNGSKRSIHQCRQRQTHRQLSCLCNFKSCINANMFRVATWGSDGPEFHGKLKWTPASNEDK